MERITRFPDSSDETVFSIRSRRSDFARGILLFVALAGLKKTPLPSNPPRPVQEIETITARKADLAVEIPAQGVIEPVMVTRAAAEVEA